MVLPKDDVHKSSMVSVIIILLLQMYINTCSSNSPLSGGMYDLSIIADALTQHPNVSHSVGQYDVRLPDGSTFYIDSTEYATTRDTITFTVEIIRWSDSVMIDGEKLFLCQPFDITTGMCPLASSKGVTIQKYDENSEDVVPFRIWTFSLDLTFVRRYVFINKADQTKQAKKTLIVSARLNPLYHDILSKNESLLKRPLPIAPIHIHNKYVMNFYGDERNLVICQNTPVSYMKIQTDHTFCRQEQALKTNAMKNTNIQTGSLSVYTPNEHGLHVSATHCFVETYTLHTTCAGFLRKIHFWSNRQRHAVSADTCKLWRENKKCTSNTLTLELISRDKGIYRTYITDHIHHKSHKSAYCLNRYHDVRHYSDCVMEMASSMSYQFPFTQIESELGPISVSRFSEKNYWVSDNKTGILIWNKTDHLIGKICPFTLLKVINTKALHKHNLHMSHDLRLGTDESVRSMTVFVGDSVENTYRVNNKQQINIWHLTKLHMDKCISMTNTCNNYMTEDNILLQFCKNNITLNTNIHHKSPALADITGSGIHPITTNITAFLHPIEDIVCHGFHEAYTDRLSHQWKCKNGFPTLISPIHFLSLTKNNKRIYKRIFAKNPNTEQPTKNVYEKGPSPLEKTDFGYPFIEKFPDVVVTWIVQQLQQIREQECETRSLLQNVVERVSFLTPTLARKFIHTQNPVYVSKSGHHYALHKCEVINWRNAEMLPSLLTNHESVNDYNTDARVGLCYTHPLIKIVSQAYNAPMIGQLMPNNRVSISLSHVQKCQNDRKKLFTLGDTIYIFSEDHMLESTQPVHHHTVLKQLLSKYHKEDILNITIPNAQHIISTVKAETASFSKNKIYKPHDGQSWSRISPSQAKYVSEFTDGDISTSISKLESTLARVDALIKPTHVDLINEQEQNLQREDLLTLPRSRRTTIQHLPPATHHLKDHPSWFMIETHLTRKYFHIVKDGFSTFINFIVIPLLITVVIMNRCELSAARNGPVNTSTGAAVGQIDKLGKRAVHDKIYTNKVMFIPRQTDSDECSDDESIIPKLSQNYG